MKTNDLPRGAAPIAFTLNGRTVEAAPGETLLGAAERAGVLLPRLCASGDLRPAGNCRACVVEIEGERVLAPSCCRAPTEGMVVRTDTPRAANARRTVLELLLADAPDTEMLKHDSELARWAREAGARAGHFASVRPELVEGLAHTSAGLRQAQPERDTSDTSHPAMTVNRDACIQCTRCIRACRETQGNDVLGLAFRGGHAQIVFDQNDPLGAPVWPAASACRPVPRAPSRRPTAPSPSLRSGRSIRSARSVVWAASCATTSMKKIASRTSKALPARPTKGACASRAASASTTRTAPSASRAR